MNLLKKVEKSSPPPPPRADHGRKIKVPGLLVSGFSRKIKMVDEDSHSTDLSVSGEGH